LHPNLTRGGYGMSPPRPVPENYLFRAGPAPPRPRHHYRVNVRGRPPLPLHDAHRVRPGRPRRGDPADDPGGIRQRQCRRTRLLPLRSSVARRRKSLRMAADDSMARLAAWLSNVSPLCTAAITRRGTVGSFTTKPAR
jgi:hypothetical protein